jgi:serine/threonine protein kinase
MSRTPAGWAEPTLTDEYDALWSGSESLPDVCAFLAAHPEATPRDRLDVLLVDQARRWQAGTPKPAEDYLAEHPDLARDPESRLDLVYGEFRASRRRGQPADPENYLARFPELRDELARQLELGQWLEPAAAEERSPVSPSSSDLEMTWDWHSAATARRGLDWSTALDDGRNPRWDSEAIDRDAPLRSDDFVLVRKLGSGGMGTVYQALQKSLGKPVAVKILKRLGERSPEAVQRFLAEGRAVARLRHPGIVGVHGIGRSPDGGYFLVMDLVEGPDLADRLKLGPIPVEEAVRIVAQVADAIEHAHQRAVIHRDLKPSNVLLDADGRVLVTDFGLAKQADCDDSGLTLLDQILGTPHYMAPEQADSRWGEVGSRTDVYGLGALLYALLTGHPPFRGRNAIEVLTRVASPEPATPPRLAEGDLPRTLAAICLKCLSKDPAQRYASAQDVAEALRAWRLVPEVAPSPTTAPESKADTPSPSPEIGSDSRWGTVLIAKAWTLRGYASIVTLTLVLSFTGLLTLKLKDRTPGSERAAVESHHSTPGAASPDAKLHRERIAVASHAAAVPHATEPSLPPAPDLALQAQEPGAGAPLALQLLPVGALQLLTDREAFLTTWLPEIVDDLKDLARAYQEEGSLARTLADYYEQAVAIQKTLVAKQPNHPEHVRALARNLARLGQIQRDSGRLEQAIVTQREALDLWEQLAKDWPEDRSHVADCCEELCNTLKTAGQFEEALMMHQRASTLATAKGPKTQPPLITWMAVRAGPDRVVDLIAHPEALAPGDQVQLGCRFAHPTFSYLFWISAEGSVSRLWPDGGPPKQPSLLLEVAPFRLDQGQATRARPGTDVAVLLARATPLSEAELAQVQAALQPTHPLPPLPEGMVLIDEVPKPVSVRVRSAESIATLLQRHVIPALLKLRRGLPPNAGQISTLALPRAARKVTPGR